CSRTRSSAPAPARTAATPPRPVTGRSTAPPAPTLPRAHSSPEPGSNPRADAYPTRPSSDLNQPTTSASRCTCPPKLNNDTFPPAPTFATTRSGVASPAPTFKFDGSGRAAPVGHTVTSDPSVASTAVTFNTTAPTPTA